MLKARITKEAKQVLTVAEMPAVQQVVKETSQNQLNDKKHTCETIETMLQHIFGESFQIINVSCEIEKNCRVWNEYFEGSSDIDVWINFDALGFYTFVHGGVYLSDLERIDGEDSTYSYIKDHMYLKDYKSARYSD